MNRKLLLLIATSVVAVAVSACDSSTSGTPQPAADSSPSVVTVTETAGATPTETADTPKLIPTKTPTSGPQRLEGFFTPSGSIFCSGYAGQGQGGMNCRLVGASYDTNYINAESCDSHRNPKATAMGYTSANSGLCWFAYSGNSPRQSDFPVVSYGESAILASPVGDVRCSVAQDGVTCAPSNGDAPFFVSKQFIGAVASKP